VQGMGKKLMTGFLVVGLCLMGIIPGLAQRTYSTLAEYEKLTGKKIEKFNQAPELAVRVAAGELPPVKERLPEEPQIVEPIEEVGEYGGMLTTLTPTPTGLHDARSAIGLEGLLGIAPDLRSIYPNICKSYEISKDGKTLTLHLRKGMKWSDGYPFTADDIMFWYEDIILNDELTPVKPEWLSPGGELAKVEKVDDYTLRFRFAVPYSSVMTRMLAHTRGMDPIRPKHYLKKFHPRYVPIEKLQKLAKEKGYDFWYQYFNYMREADCGCIPTNNPDLPTIIPYVLKKKGMDYFLFERNPYYWKIDTAGNQLPYIDKILVKILRTPEIINGKIISGEIDLEFGYSASIDNYTLYKKNEKAGNYRALTCPYVTTSDVGYQPNQTYKDPVLRKIFQDVRFRRALSLAINRDEINEAVYYGFGIPSQVAVVPECSYYEEKFAKAYAEYDPQEANRLLDEMGLKWDKNHEYRLRPDGKRLAWTIEYYEFWKSWTKTSELVKEYWKDIGIDVSLKQITGELLGQRAQTNEIAMGLWTIDKCTDFLFIQDPEFWVPWRTGWEVTWCPAWARWFQTKGEKGEEPPEEMKKLYNWWQKMRCATSKEEEIEYAKKILASQAQNVWIIGTVACPPWPVILRDNLKNFPNPKEVRFGWDYLQTYPWHPEQFFLKHPLLPSQK